MAENYSRSVLRVVIAQLSQAVGFNSIHSSSLDILTNVLERYLLALGKTVHDYGENCLQTHPHLSDVEFALRQLHVSIPDMLDYMQQMEPVAFPHKVTMFPMPKASNLQFPSGNNPEDFKRDEHIPLYMPSLVMASTETTEKKEDENAAPAAGQSGKAANFVIAGKHSQDSSSGEEDYSAGELSNEDAMSDDSLSHNPSKSRHLTKPEDIPTIEGTAPSSMMSVPSSADLDELHGSKSPSRRFSYESAEDQSEMSLKKGRKPSLSMDKSLNRRPSQTADDVPWLNQENSNSNKWPTRTPEVVSRKTSWASQPSKQQSENPKWVSKNPQDKYDADWLQDEPASPVHLTKPPTPDGTAETTTLQKRSWYDDEEKSPGPSSISQSTPKRRDPPYPGAKSEFGHKISTSTPNSGQKQLTKPYSDRKPPHHKHYKTPFKPASKKSELGDGPIKARIEAAEKLIHSPPVPPYIPSSPKPIKKKHILQQSPKSPVRSSIERAEKLLKHPLVENVHFSSRESSPAPNKPEKIVEKQKDSKHDRSSNFASSKSMYDAIDAVINRAVKEDEEARKEAEDAELMKFSHLVKDSSSSDSEPDVTDKAEQMLQLEERGLREARPPTPGSPAFQPPTPLSAATPQSFAIDDDDDEDNMTIDTDDESSGITPISRPSKPIKSPHHTPKPPKSEKHVKKEKHKKKSRKASRDDSSNRTPKIHSSSKTKGDKPSPRPPGASFVTTETISESKSVKMKVKLKPSILDHVEPKLFDVDKDRDRIRITEGKQSKSTKEERHKLKDGKHHKTKEHKKHQSSKPFEPRPSPVHLDQSVEKIILKKSKSGDAKVVKPKIVEHKRSPSPPSPIASRNLPLPKLSAAVPVMSVTAISKEKDKKKSKKEKKKKKDRDRERSHEKSHEKEKHHDKSREKSHDKERSKDREEKSSSRRESKDADSSLMVPKLTLKMGASEKKFVIKQPSASSSKSSGKKRSHSFIADSPIPAKERKVSVETIKQDTYSPAVERKVITQTISAGPVGVIEDAEGNKIWICPGCNKPDDGSPMIGCDTCDDWYHWPCVNINKEPPDDQDWFCPRCTKRQLSVKAKALGKKRKKK